MSGLKEQLRLRILLPTAVLALAGIGMSAFAFGGSPPIEGSDPLPTPPAQQGGAGTTTKKPPEPAPVKLTAWAKEADRACRGTLEAAEAIEEAQTPDALAAQLSQILDLNTKLAATLAALPRPAAERKGIARLVGFAERSNAALSGALELQAAPEAANEFAGAMDESYALGEKFDALAVRLGADDCAVDSTKPLTPLEKALLRDKVVVVVLHAADATVDRLAIREARSGADSAKVGFLAVDVGGAKDLATITKTYGVRKAPAVLVMRRWVGAVTRFGGWIDATTVAQAVQNAKR